MSEIDEKLGKLRRLMRERALDGIVIGRISNFAWLTAGASGYVNTAAETGVATALVTQDEQYVVTNNIEAPRLKAEEALADVGFDLRAAPWHAANPILGQLAAGLRLGADMPYPGAVDLAEDLMRLRITLTPPERSRIAALGQACAEAMDQAIRKVRPGMREYEIAGLLAGETLARGASPIVNLIATDERIYKFRHPLPADKRLEKYAMLVLCGRQAGLVCSVTRLVHFGPLPAELRQKQDACVRIDATFCARTRPGTPVADVFGAAVAAYRATGYPHEWELHHQGGPAGYEPREYIATPGVAGVVEEGQAYAWNPSITGIKTEDTILVGAATNEILTEIPGWPTIAVEIDGQTWRRPAVLEVS